MYVNNIAFLVSIKVEMEWSAEFFIFSDLAEYEGNKFSSIIMTFRI